MLILPGVEILSSPGLCSVRLMLLLTCPRPRRRLEPRAPLVVVIFVEVVLVLGGGVVRVDDLNTRSELVEVTGAVARRDRVDFLVTLLGM
jgi:hypothetical protein